MQNKNKNIETKVKYFLIFFKHKIFTYPNCYFMFYINIIKYLTLVSILSDLHKKYDISLKFVNMEIGPKTH